MSVYNRHIVFGFSLAQASKQREQVEDAVHEMSKPLARYANDQDLDAELRTRERVGDPMLAFIAKKKAKTEKKSSEHIFKDIH